MHGVDQVVDVGANIGDFGQIVREEGFDGTIHSFEPLTEAFQRLVERASSDPRWHCHRLALGDTAGDRLMNRSANLVSSSLLELTDLCIEQDATTAYVGQEGVSLSTLDNINDLGPGPTWMKLDVQGYELHVLRGGTQFLDRVVGLDCEVSLVPLYDGQPLVDDVVSWLRERGFVPSWVEPGVIHSGTGAMLQADMTFERA